MHLFLRGCMETLLWGGYKNYMNIDLVLLGASVNVVSTRNLDFLPP